MHGAWCVVRGAWCVVRGSWCVVRGAWCVVRGAWCVVRGFGCVGLAPEISARCKRASNTGSYVFSFFFLCILISFMYYHICMFFDSLRAFP